MTIADLFPKWRIATYHVNGKVYRQTYVWWLDRTWFLRSSVRNADAADDLAVAYLTSTVDAMQAFRDALERFGPQPEDE